MSRLRMPSQRSHIVAAFDSENLVVYDGGACDMPKLKDMMLSGYTPSTRVAQYHSDLVSGIGIKEMLDSVEKPPLDVTDVISSKNYKELNDSIVQQNASDVNEAVNNV